MVNLHRGHTAFFFCFASLILVVESKRSVRGNGCSRRTSPSPSTSELDRGLSAVKGRHAQKERGSSVDKSGSGTAVKETVVSRRSSRSLPFLSRATLHTAKWAEKLRLFYKRPAVSVRRKLAVHFPLARKKVNVFFQRAQDSWRSFSFSP